MLITCFLLIILCFVAIAAMFLSENYSKRILALSISHGSIVLLIVLLALESSRKNEVTVMVVTITAIFAINLLVAAFLVKNLNDKKSI